MRKDGLIALVVVVASSATLLAVPNLFRKKAEKQDRAKSIEGTWIIVAMERRGIKRNETARKVPRTIVFKGGEYIPSTLRPRKTTNLTYQIDMTKLPATLDITVNDGPKGRRVRIIKGICEFQGDLLRYCYDPITQTRPGGFTTKDTRCVILDLKRESPPR